MWNWVSGKKDEGPDNSASRTTGRPDEDSYAGRRSGSAKSASSKKKVSRDTDDDKRVFKPTSTAYSSTSQVAYPNTAGASVASSHATATANGNDGSYTTPVLNRNQSLADKMPKASTSSRAGRDWNDDDEGDRKNKSNPKSSRDEDDGRREKKNKRDKTERKSTLRNGRTSRSIEDTADGTNRGPAEFSQQVGSSGFQQFPGQYDGDVLGGSVDGQNGAGTPSEHDNMSSHVQDQFPGQFPSESAEPYRPPLAANEGGPGLAADYYGDIGQSVAEQPGFRQNSPSLIIGQEPHLRPASSVAAPPPEPSASGGVGAAASFLSGEFQADETTSVYTSTPSKPNMAATSSGLPGLGSAVIGATAAAGAAAGATAGYMMGNPSLTQQHDAVSTAGTASEYMTTSSQQFPSQTQGSYYSSTSQAPGPTSSQPPATGSRPSHLDNIPIYAAAAAGVAGLAGTAMHNSHNSSTVHASSNQQYAIPTTPRHRHRGPFAALVDFVKDPEGVAQFEEYSEYVGICRGCFEPGSSPRDAPRRHRKYNRKRSDEHIGRTSRVEKTRRDGSDDERRGAKSPSWLATGPAGYGLGKMGEKLFKQGNNFDDTYSVRTGRYSPDGDRNRREKRESDVDVRQRRRTEDGLETGVIRDTKIYKKDANVFGASGSSQPLRRRSRSRSRTRKTSQAGAAVGAATHASFVGSASRHRSYSGDRATTKSKHTYRDGSPSGLGHRSRRKKKDKGFFSFGPNSSSSSVDLAHPGPSKKSKSKSDDRKAEAALLGLGAATAALVAADRGSNHRKGSVKELVGRKETISDAHQPPAPEDVGWEDEEDYVSEAESVDSGLAFGNDSDRSEGVRYDRRRRTEMSGKGSLPGRRSSWDKGAPAVIGAIGTAVAVSEFVPADHNKESSRHNGPSPPLQYVEPMPVSDYNHLDEKMADAMPLPSRPPLVSRPSDDTQFHQPQPRAPIASSVYAAQTPYSHTRSATAGSATYPSPSYNPQQDPTPPRDFKLRRRDTSPAKIGPTEASTELTYHRKPSAKDDSSAVSGVRFALSEKEDMELREKRRQKKGSRSEEPLNKERHEQEGEPDEGDEPRRRQNPDNQSRQSGSPVDSSSRSWAVPAAVGIAGAAAGAAAIIEGRKKVGEEETKEERRERRRREKRRDEEEYEDRRARRRKEEEDGVKDISSRTERYQNDDRDETREERKARRRREREEHEQRDAEGEAPPVSHVSFGVLPQGPDRSSDDRASPESKEPLSKKEAYKHEDYSSFFSPDLDANGDQQVKISGANADANISFDQSPNFVIAEPKGFRELSGTPDFSPADTNDKIDLSTLKFPWQVPRLRLLYPTPPSTRGSTPIIEPRDVRERDVEEPPEIRSFETSTSQEAQANDTINHHGILVSEPRDVVDRFRDPPSDDEPERLERRKPKKIPLSIDQEIDSTEPASYGDDNSFAAVIAASAEDAGFDPSIVIDNPAYRRRDSPPGSNGRHIPGGFEDEEDENRPKKSNRKDRSYRRQSPPEGRNDDIVVKDMVDQVERTEPDERNGPEAESNNIDMLKGKKTKKAKKGSKRSLALEEARESQDPARQDLGSESRPSFEEPMEDARSAAVSTTSRKDGYSSKLSNKSESDISVFEEAASTAAVAAAVAAGKDSKSNGKKKGSIWDRVLGKSTSASSETTEAKGVKKEEPVEVLEQDVKERRKSKQDAAQSNTDGDSQRLEDDIKDSSKPESEVSRSTIPSAGSVAPYLIEDSDPEQSQEKVSESFLGERPDPPPPPDAHGRSEEPPGTSASGLSQEGELRSTPNSGLERPSENPISDAPQSPRQVSSPTAVPIHFRRPAHARSRSSSQSPLSSFQTADEIPQPSRPRPRSTQFENSKEYRPLWLVERNQSRQEIPRDETYPLLPSSHSTSRDSSLHSTKSQHDSEIIEDWKSMPPEGDHGLLIDSGSRAVQSELLDSQQATPTATSFQRTSATGEQPSPSQSRSNSPTRTVDTSEKRNSTLRDATLAAVLGGTAAFALHRASEEGEIQDQHFSEKESENPRGKSADVAADAQKTDLTTTDEQEEFAPLTGKEDGKHLQFPDRELEDSAAQGTSSIENIEAAGNLTGPILPSPGDEDAGVSKEMPAYKINDKTSLTGQDTEYMDDVIPKLLPANVETTESKVERSESKKSKKKKKGKKNFIDVDEPIDEEPNSRQEPDDSKPASIRGVAFTDPFEKASTEHVKDCELSPKATPLPDDDDFDLFEEPSRPELDESTQPLVDNMRAPPEETVESQAGMETNAEDYFNAPTKKRSKKDKKGKQNILGDIPADRPEISVNLASDEANPTETKEASQENAMEPATAPLEGAREAEDDFMGFSSKKKAKKGKKGKPSAQETNTIEDLKAGETEENQARKDVGRRQKEEVQPEIAAERGPEDVDSAPTGINTVEVPLPSQEARGSEDELASFSSKKKRKKDKKKKAEILFDEPKTPEPELPEPEEAKPEQTEPERANIEHIEPGRAEPKQAEPLVEPNEEPRGDAPVEPPLLQEDSYEPSPRKKKSKKPKEREVDPSYGEDALPLATTSTSKDVQDILNESRGKVEFEQTPNETAAIESTLFEDPPSNHDGGLELSQQHKSLSSFDGRNDAIEVLSATTAVTGTASAVQNILRESDRPPTPIDDKGLDAQLDRQDQSVEKLSEEKDYPIVLSKEEGSQNAMQEERAFPHGLKESEPTELKSLHLIEPSANGTLETEAVEKLATKKSKKSKKGKKSDEGEAFTYNESVTPESAEISSIAPESSGQAPDGAGGDFVESFVKKPKKDKKGEKSSLSRSVSQGPAEEMLGGSVAKEVAESPEIDSKTLTVEANDGADVPLEAEESTMKEVEEEDFGILPVQKSKKDKKKKKKDLSRTASGVQTPELAEGPTLDRVRTLPRDDELPDTPQAETLASLPKSVESFANDEPANQITEPREREMEAPLREGIETSAIIEPTDQTNEAEERQREEPGSEAVSKSKSKKEKKKSKKAKVFTWDDEPNQEPNDEAAVATTDALGDNELVDSLDSKLTEAGDGTRQVYNAEESRGVEPAMDEAKTTSKSKKDKKKSKKAKDVSRSAYETKDLDQEPPVTSQDLEDSKPTQPPLNEVVSATELLEDQFERSSGEVEIDKLIQEERRGDAGQNEFNEVEDESALISEHSKEEQESRKERALPTDYEEPLQQQTLNIVETPSLEPTESSFDVKADAVETPGLERNEPSYNGVASAPAPVITTVRGPRDVPEHLTFDDIIEPSAIIEPREQHARNDLPQTTFEGPSVQEVVAASPEEDFSPAKKTKKGKKSKKSKTVEFRPEDGELLNSEQPIPTEKEIEPSDDVLIVEGHQAHAPDEPDYQSREESTPKVGEKSRKSFQINTNEPEIIEYPPSESFETRPLEHTSQPDTPLSTGSLEMLDPEEQKKYNEEYRKQLEKELSPLREDDNLLNTEEQRNYNEEYREELERQLNNSQGVEEIAVPTTLSSSQESFHPLEAPELVENPIPSPLEATLHHTVLSDIIEEKEPRSRSGSLKEPPTKADGGVERKRSKKGKNSKKSSQPVIWEDDTATTAMTDDVGLSIHREESPPPMNHQESVEKDKAIYNDLPSPGRGSPSASRSPKFDDDAEDYFAVRPRAPPEKDIRLQSEPLDQRAISPEQSQDLPDWSSQPKEHPLAGHFAGATMMEQERPRRERSPSRERRPRKRSPSPERTQPQTSTVPHEQSVSWEGLGTIGESAAAAAAVAGIVSATQISRKESKKGKKGKAGKAAKRSKERAQPDDNNDEVKQEQDEASPNDIDHPQPPEKVDERPEKLSSSPPHSPKRSDSLERFHEESQRGEDPKHRDSAIQITDSPMVPVSEAIHRPQHDSGYPATESSPLISDYAKDGQEEPEIIDPYTDARVKSTGFYQDQSERPKSITSDPRYSIAGSDEQDMSSDRRRSRRRRKRRGSNATYDSDDSNDSGYDKQRRRRQALMAEEAREPSPVSSTTKNRSSVLFDSSPSDRQLLEEAKHMRGDLLDNNDVHNEQHRLDHPDSQTKEKAATQSQDLEPYLGAQEAKEPRHSIFGGPVNEEEALSGSRSPASSDTRGRQKLKTISEDSLENSPLARKGKRNVSDVGSPDSGNKVRRTSHDLAPLVIGAAAGAAAIGGEDLVQRLHKSTKAETGRPVDMERSSSRGQDRPRRLSNQSNTSAPNRDSEWRRQAINSPDSIHAIIRTPDQVRSSGGQSPRSSGTPPLRRVDRSISGDLRGASLKIDAKRRAKTAEAELDSGPAIAGASSSTYDPLIDKGKNRGDMADIYEGDGWRGESPMSPTRPPSMRKRQSMQFADLEQRFEQLAADHRSLQNAKSVADRRFEEQARDHSQQRQTYEEAMQDHKSYLAERDAELSRLHDILDRFKRQVSELTSVNEELQTSRGLDPDRVGDQSFQILAGQHDTTKRELEDLREQHVRLAKDHEDILEREVEAVRQENDYELRQLQEELESAKEQVRALQQQIVASRTSDDYIEHDEDYFESKCTALCQHVQQWVLRFSKFSDNRACRLVGDLGDDTLADLFDDAILDGTEADEYLQDRIKRRDVFMSVVMSRIFDFIFRRYLFGLDREQRKKLKDLDATLTEVGPQSAVHKWRSTTLTLLSSREVFADQREADTEGVVDSIFQTLSAILPPKKDLIPQITDSLRRVVVMAVDLHIEMRLQLAEFQMLPPLKPQFDPATGDLTRKVPFNATMMNERSGDTESNERLQEDGAVVRMVLFPLVVKNSDEEEQIVVCPAQVLVAKEEAEKKTKKMGNGNGKQVRVMSAQGARSEISFAGTEDTQMTTGNMF